MSNAKNFIDFTLIIGKEEIRIKTYVGEYADLRLLIEDYANLDNFGECGGMGRCATCMVVDSSEVSKNEKFDKVPLTRSSRPIRLSCQLPVDDELANKYIIVLFDRD